ncbi:hypothetical protein JCM30760_07730 [Thiomicrorhabdus hydrogeniphila]
MKKIIKILLLLTISINAHSEGLKTNYENVPVSRLVPIISDLTQKSFTYSPDVSDISISLSVPNDKSINETYALFKDALRASGLKVYEDSNNLVTIVNQDNESYYSAPGHFKTFIIYLRNAKTKDVQSALSHLISYEGSIQSVGDHLILITDTQENFNTLNSIIKKIDLDRDESIVTEILTLNNVKPSLIKPVDGVTIEPYDTLHRLQITGKKSLIHTFTKNVYSLDQSLKTLSVKMLITSVTKSKDKEFNIVPILSNGAVQLTGTGFAINTIKEFTSGISFLFNFLKSKQDVTIHSQPFIQLLEGEQASFNVGREVPIRTSQIVQETGQIIDNIERKKVGLSVEVSATVRPDNLIYLTLNQNFSSISETQLSTVSDIITDDQSLSTTLLVSPGTVYAVGGIIDKRKTNSDSDLAFFDIPISSNDSDLSQEIYIFLQVDAIAPKPM